MLKILAWLVGGVLGLAVLYTATALLLGEIPVNRDFQIASNGVPIAVCSNGVHTDFVLPVKSDAVDWSRNFPPAQYPADVTRFDHIGIGWGNLDFYRSTPTWSDFDPGTALRALLGLGPAAMHVQYRPGPGASENCRRLEIGLVQYRQLANYVSATLASTDPVAPGYGATDCSTRPRDASVYLRAATSGWVGASWKRVSPPASGRPLHSRC